MIGNRLIQPKADEALERQPVAQRFLKLHVREAVERLQKQRLEHHQRSISGPTGALARVITQPRKVLLETVPLHQRRQLVQPTRPFALRDQRIGETELATIPNRHRIISAHR